MMTQTMQWVESITSQPIGDQGDPILSAVIHLLIRINSCFVNLALIDFDRG